MIMTLGYYYDRINNRATWMSDTWEMEMSPPYLWSQRHLGISQDEAYEAYTNNRALHSPAGRFGHSSSVHNSTLYVYGGHDGGQSRHGRQNYEPGYDFDELWRLDPEPRGWTLIPSSSEGPGKRYLHSSAVVGDLLLIYGGLAESQGDVWAFNLVTSTWTRLAADAPRISGRRPGRRVGHTMTAVDQPSSSSSSSSGRTRGFLVIGGRHVGQDEISSLDETAYFFDLDTSAWRAVPPPSASSSSLSPAPSGRKYHAEASAWVGVSEDGTLVASAGAGGGGSSKQRRSLQVAQGAFSSYVHVTVIAGGTITTPRLTCTAEAWLATLDCAGTALSWTRLPDLPFSVYDVRGATSSSEVSTFMYGGHLCTDSKTATKMEFSYTNTVSKLDLTSIKVPPGACRVKFEDLPRQRGQGGAGAAQDEL